MNIRIFNLVVCALAQAFCFAQVPDTVWTKTYGGSYNDVGLSVQQLVNGGYVIAGETYSFGPSYDGYLIRSDEYGDTLWTRRYGGPDHDGIYSIEVTSDGGFIMAGYTYSYGSGNSDVFLVKTDSLGDTRWTKTYGGDTFDIGKCVRQTSDGGYIIGGSTVPLGAGYDDMYLIKTTANGDTLWTCAYGDSLYDWCNAVEITCDGGYILVGRSSSNIGLVRVDSTGTEIWSGTYGPGVANEGFSVVETSDGGFIVGGFTRPYWNTPFFFYLFRTDDQGDTLWTSMGVTTYSSGTSDLLRTADNCYIAAGGMWSGSPFIIYGDILLVKIDEHGNILWTATYDITSYEVACAIQMTLDNGYVIAGKLSVQPVPTGDYDALLVKLGPELGNHEYEEIAVGNCDQRPTIVKGPLLLTAGKKYRVFDIAGREVNTTDPAPGIYFIQLENDTVQKVVKVR